MSADNHDDGHKEGHSHHILSNRIGLRIFLTLLILTFITVVASRIDFGAFNFAVAMFIASAKALLVVLFFMGLKYDNNEDRIIFASSFVFVAIFVLLTAADAFTRGNEFVKVQGPVLAASTGAFKFKKPWLANEEIVAHGKKLFDQNCALCHGGEGKGNGPAAGNLNPRNFTQNEGWKNGRKLSQIMGTLDKGLNLMPSFQTIALDDRFSLAHYVRHFGPQPAPEDSAEDLKTIGIKDTEKDDGGLLGGEQKRTLPVDFAMERYLQNP